MHYNKYNKHYNYFKKIERETKMIIYLYVLIGCVILFINIFNGLLVWTNNVNNILYKIAVNSAIIFLIITVIILFCL